jgi:hypothetical protein
MRNHLAARVAEQSQKRLPRSVGLDKIRDAVDQQVKRILNNESRASAELHRLTAGMIEQAVGVDFDLPDGCDLDLQSLLLVPTKSHFVGDIPNPFNTEDAPRASGGPLSPFAGKKETRRGGVLNRCGLLHAGNHVSGKEAVPGRNRLSPE